MPTPSPSKLSGQPRKAPRPLQAKTRAAAEFDYDVECDWYLLSTCNYRCTYCFLSTAELGEKMETYATPEQWRAAYDGTGKRWLIHITGGEPTIYPDFIAICEGLTQRHTISINTNLSRPVVKKMAGLVDPARVSFINAGLHVAERRQRKGLEVYLDNACFLQDAGFRIFVTIVATPEAVADLRDLDAICAERGLQLAPKVLRGAFEGKIYPREYAPEEKAHLRDAIVRARDWYAEKYEGWPSPSIDVLSDDDLLDGQPIFLGRPCSAGSRFVRVSQDGQVHRCNSSRPSLGNLLKGTLRFDEGPKPCDTHYCVYFCKKYTADALMHAKRSRQTQQEIAL